MTEAERVCANVAPSVRAHAIELFEQLDFMLGRLQDSREHMKDAPIIIRYADSRGNTRTKENPAFSAYNSLMRNYVRTLSEFHQLVGSGASRPASVERFDAFAKTMRKTADA